jgi:hypothetical protein
MASTSRVIRTPIEARNAGTLFKTPAQSD